MIKILIVRIEIRGSTHVDKFRKHVESELAC
jgi:hypothetical protein